MRRSATDALTATIIVTVLLSACSPSSETTPADAKPIDCRGGDSLLLAFQAVPSATYVPCISSIPVGWAFGGSGIRNGLVQFFLNSDRAGFHAAEITLTKSCDVAGAVKGSGASPEPGITHYEKPLSLTPRFMLLRYDVFTGGCITYRFAFRSGASSLLAFELDQALSFFPRSLAIRKAHEQIGLTLCGAGAPPCPG
jgi:hypothetical protein